jgi:hypothetical protein
MNSPLWSNSKPRPKLGVLSTRYKVEEEEEEEEQQQQHPNLAQKKYIKKSILLPPK